MRQSFTSSLLAMFIGTAFGLFACAPKQAATPAPAPKAMVENDTYSEAAEEDELARSHSADEESDTWGSDQEKSDPWGSDQETVEDDQLDPVDETPEQPDYEYDTSPEDYGSDDYGDGQGDEGDWE